LATDRRIGFSWKTNTGLGHYLEVSYYEFGVFVEKYTSTYEYDSKGNLVKETYIRWLNESGKWRSYPVLVLYREITYY